MRIWSLHPQYLDRLGLLACWRESLLAQKVLLEQTKGYTHHPQLTRFQACPDPTGAIAAYLAGLAEEADRRGYAFDRTRIVCAALPDKLAVSRGQMRYEWQHLQAKLARRDPSRLAAWAGLDVPEAHPLFEVVEGDVEAWEKRSYQNH